MKVEHTLLPGVWEELGRVVDRISQQIYHGAKEDPSSRYRSDPLYCTIFTTILRYQLDHLRMEDQHESSNNDYNTRPRH